MGIKILVPFKQIWNSNNSTIPSITNLSKTNTYPDLPLLGIFIFSLKVGCEIRIEVNILKV